MTDLLKDIKDTEETIRSLVAKRSELGGKLSTLRDRESQLMKEIQEMVGKECTIEEAQATISSRRQQVAEKFADIKQRVQDVEGSVR